MNCKEINKSVIRYIENELTPEKESEFKEHITKCEECSVLYSDFSVTYDALNTKHEIEPKAFFTESVMNKIDSEKAKENIFDITLDIAISKFFKKFAYTGIAFIIALFILLYTTDNLSLFNNPAEEEYFPANEISSIFFDNF
ncbi:MAG: zf-HC2 domain-containing protein [Ignavibacteriae bacterium]|nr:zf-HC2 domain-containing protein [Ignavibacteriota bacterium]